MNFEKSDTIKIIDHLPKYLQDVKTGETYVLTMIKNDWDGNDDAYFIRYAKENKQSISTVKYLFEVAGRRFDEAVYSMYLRVSVFQRAGKIKGKIWIGENDENSQRERDLSTFWEDGSLFEEEGNGKM